MVGEKNPLHANLRGHRSSPDVETRGLQERNEAIGKATLPAEEPHDIRKAGGGVKGESQGGAHTGRYGPAPGKVVSNRASKPRGQDDEERS